MTPQELLTAATTIVEVAAIALTALGIVATGFNSPTAAAPVQAAPVPTAEVSQQVAQPQQSVPQQPTQPQAAPIAPSIAPVVQQSRPQTSTRQLSRCELLRQQCAARGITWRNANGKGKHLSTQQMQQRLGQPAIA